jgi:hypothetical protein
MGVQVHGFDWVAYTRHIMPAFAQWLIERDESALEALFQETRLAREEAFLPAALQSARIWPRAQNFAATLPMGQHSKREYAKLCHAEEFTILSDRYLYRHVPRLYQNPEPVRAIWGALIETYCLPWSTQDINLPDALQNVLDEDEEAEENAFTPFKHASIEREEILDLLQEAGLGELAREISAQVEHKTEHLPDLQNPQNSQDAPEDELQMPTTQPLSAERLPEQPDQFSVTYTTADDDDLRLAEEEEEAIEEHSLVMPGGINIGAHPNTLQLRGWLAGVSVTALALFEYLACGRRIMPFGYDAGEPYGVFVGYLTPDEVWRLGTALRGVPDPEQFAAEAAYLRYRYQRPGLPENARLIDEVLPFHAAAFHRAVDMAAAQGLGLICSSE